MYFQEPLFFKEHQFLKLPNVCKKHNDQYIYLSVCCLKSSSKRNWLGSLKGNFSFLAGIKTGGKKKRKKKDVLDEMFHLVVRYSSLKLFKCN